MYTLKLMVADAITIITESIEEKAPSGIVSLQQYLDTDKKQTFNKYREMLQKEDA